MQKLALLLFVAVLFVGCDRFSEQDFDAALIKNFEIVIDENTGDIAFSLEEIMDALENEGIEPIQESIVRYNIRDIKYKVWEYAGPAESKWNGSLSILSQDGSSLYDHAVVDRVLLELNDDEDHPKLPFTQEQKDRIAEELLNGNSFRIKAEGSISETPVSFILQVVADVTATADLKD